MRLLTALFFCILSLSVYSFSAPDSVSQVKGKVIDKFTRKPLSNINVVTEDCRRRRQYLILPVRL